MNTRTNISNIRNRVAVICVGGWGLQTMLHLWPRLRTIQEERFYLGIDRDLTDLSRLSAFAAIMPNPLVPNDLADYQPIKMLKPDPNNYPPAFYVEQHLSEIIDKLSESNDGKLTNLLYSERVADLVMQHATGTLSKGMQTGTSYVEVLPIHTLGTRPIDPPAIGAGRRLTRQEMFQMGLAWSEPIVRALEHYVIDPTRMDYVQPQNAFVQTSVYLVASLAEPMTSALLWPLMAELMATLGSGNVVNVVAMLATGSFADDHTLRIEEGASYAALAELEALQGLPSRKESTKALKALVQKMTASRPAWKDRVGTQIFNHVFLLDRVKSNQSLVRDAQELAVLTGNAIEAFLTTDGLTYIEEQLGASSGFREHRPYSAIGAANYYVPLSTYMQAAIEEQKREIARATILAEPKNPQAALSDLKATPESALRSLVQPRTGRIFSAATSRSLWPALKRLGR